MELDYNQKVGLATERLKLWGEALMTLAQEDIPARLIGVLEEGNRKELQALLGPVRLFQIGDCIDIVETITKVINFGPGHFEERCHLMYRLWVEPPSQTRGRVYRLPDGNFVWISEYDWAEYFKHAENDPVWREANKEFLKALGILSCTYEHVPDSAVVTINKTQKICFPTVISP